MHAVDGSARTRVLALAASEMQLVIRNRLILVGAAATPLALGLFWVLMLPDSAGPLVPVLQVTVALGMGLYNAATQTLVVRRQSRVFLRWRNTSVPDRGILAATVVPSLTLSLTQLTIFFLIDLVAGLTIASNPTPVVLGLTGGVVFGLTGAAATAVITRSAERASLTTLPLTLALLGGGAALAITRPGTWWDAVLLVPGAAVGRLISLGDPSGTGSEGATALILPLLAITVWSVIFAAVARRQFRWDPWP